LVHVGVMAHHTQILWLWVGDMVIQGLSDDHIIYCCGSSRSHWYETKLHAR
jgi:hypothetical protein